MKLVILGNPHIHDSTGRRAVQTIAVKYDPANETTTVDCDIDIVTLGVAVNVLQEQYEEGLKKLSPHMAERVKETTRKAVTYFERDTD